ncbi:MAG: hypothetical protein HOP28_13840 [Gemmatimonadales bacterium]|nr:hypothetical protein [Gemmatimonadales bacterium]
MTKPGERPQLWEIPNGTSLARCKKCGASGLYWIKTRLSAWLLVDPSGAGCLPPTTLRPGYGVAHIIRCAVAKAERDANRQARVDAAVAASHD